MVRVFKKLSGMATVKFLNSPEWTCMSCGTRSIQLWTRLERAKERHTTMNVNLSRSFESRNLTLLPGRLCS